MEIDADLAGSAVRTITTESREKQVNNYRKVLALQSVSLL
jgi:hypothetical protein